MKVHLYLATSEVGVEMTLGRGSIEVGNRAKYLAVLFEPNKKRQKNNKM